MKKGFVIGLATGLTVAGASLVLANSEIQAILNNQIKVALNGQVQEFRDEKTNEIQYPITYHDRTYLPLRTVANLVGIDVDYDESSNTAILIDNKNLTNYGSFEEILEKTKNKVQVYSNYYDKYLSVNYMEICSAIDSGNLYYTYLDINNNGEKDLIIYDTSYETPIIYGVFTKYDNKIYECVTGWIRNKYYLREGYIFENQGSNGATDSVYTLGMIKYYGFDEILKLHLTSESENIIEETRKNYEKIIENHPLIQLEGTKITAES